MTRARSAGRSAATQASSGGRKAYHHGDLRRALVESALAILERDGVAALSLRAVARASGVSQAAPYSHFADKQALLAAVAERGFADLAQSMAEAARGARAPAARVKALARGYVRFAISRPALFRLTFGPELLPDQATPRVADAGQEAYRMIEAAVTAHRAQTRQSRASNTVATSAAWALVHGLATLVLDGLVPAPRDAAALEDEMVDPVAGMLISGM